MIFQKPPTAVVAQLILAIEDGARKFISNGNKLMAIIFLRESAGGQRVRDFLIKNRGAVYSKCSDGNFVLGLADAKQWVDHLAQGQSILGEKNN